MSRLLETMAPRAAGCRIVLAVALLLAALARLPTAFSAEVSSAEKANSHSAAHADCADVQGPSALPAYRAAKGPGDTPVAIAAMAVSPDGSRLAVAQEDRTAVICRSSDGQIVHRFAGHQDAVTSVAFSPDGRLLATASFDRTVRIWQAEHPDQQPLILRGHDNWVFDVVFSPDGRLLASCGYDKAVRLWDPATGAEAGKLTGHAAGVRSVAFSPDGKLLASAGSDRMIKLWQLSDRRELATLSGHEGAIRKVAFSPDGKLLASASEDKHVKLWDVAERGEKTTLSGHEQIVWTLAFSPSGATLASGGMDNTVRLWDVAKATLRRSLKPQSETLVGLCFAPDGRGLFSATEDQSLMFWKSRPLPVAPLARLDEPAAIVLFSPDGRWCVHGGKGGVVYVRDMASGGIRHKLSGHKTDLTCAAFSADGGRLATGSGEKKLRIWNCQAWTEKPQTIKTHHKQLAAVAWAPDGRLVSSGGDGRVCVWRPGTAEPLLKLTKQTMPVDRLAISPDGKQLATASNYPGDDQTPGEVKVWDLDSGREVGKLGPHLGKVKGVLYTADGRNLVTYGSFLAVRVWHVASLHEVAAWSVPNSINSICRAGGGSTLAIGDTTGSIDLRSLSGALGPAFKGHQKAVLAIASSPDGTLLATAALDEAIAFWPTGLKLAQPQHPATASATHSAAEMVAAWSAKASLSSADRPAKSQSSTQEGSP